MDIRRLLHNPDDGGWFVIGETKSEAEMADFRRSLKRNAIINTHLVNCTMSHDNNSGINGTDAEHKMKVQWTKCTSALCHPKGQQQDGDGDDDGGNDSDGSSSSSSYGRQSNSSTSTNQTEYQHLTQSRKSPAACPVQLRMSTCQLTFAGIVCQAYQHLSDAHDSAEPLQSCVTEDMKTHIVRMLEANRDVKPMVIYKELLKIHRHGVFGDDLMPTKIQLRNALTYLRSRKLKQDATAAAASQSRTHHSHSTQSHHTHDSFSRSSSLASSASASRKRTYDSFSDGSASPPCDEQRQPERGAARW
ncbi:hypothetical protein Gpo141_00014384 [Globisporangium polare]